MQAVNASAQGNRINSSRVRDIDVINVYGNALDARTGRDGDFDLWH
jgi:hypothetical protein